MPDSVEIPAPVSATTRRASRSHAAIWSSSTGSGSSIGEREYVPVGAGRVAGHLKKAAGSGMFDGYRTFIRPMATSLATSPPTSPAEIRSRDYDRRWWVLGVLCVSLVLIVSANA